MYQSDGWPPVAASSASGHISLFSEIEITSIQPTDVLVVDGNSLTTEDVVKLGDGKFKIQLSAEAKERVRKSRDFLEEIVAENRVVYGVTTGFGKFATTVIDRHSLKVMCMMRVWKPWREGCVINRDVQAAGYKCRFQNIVKMKYTCMLYHPERERENKKKVRKRKKESESVPPPSTSLVSVYQTAYGCVCALCDMRGHIGAFVYPPVVYSLMTLICPDFPVVIRNCKRI